jgi:major membrane immunogen (membrane-anchored lipoprotein)
MTGVSKAASADLLLKVCGFSDRMEMATTTATYRQFP